MEANEREGIKARLDAATPGPWDLNQRQYSLTILGPSGYPLARTLDETVSFDQAFRNATFIANAPTDVAALLAEIAELREANERRGDLLREVVNTAAVLRKNLQPNWKDPGPYKLMWDASLAAEEAALAALAPDQKEDG